MIVLRGLDGSPVLLAEGSIYRLRPPRPGDDDPVTQVDYGGGYIFTREALADLAARLAPGVRFVELTTRGGQSVWLNPAQVTRIREALPINAPGTEITIAGRYQHVTNTLDETIARLT